MNHTPQTPSAWPLRPYPKQQLALAYSNLDHPASALRQLWVTLSHAYLDGSPASLLVRQAADSPRGKYFNNRQVEIIYRALGMP